MVRDEASMEESLVVFKSILIMSKKHQCVAVWPDVRDPVTILASDHKNDDISYWLFHVS